MIPCEECISYAMCVNQYMVECTLIYNYYEERVKKFGKAITQSHADVLDEITMVLKKTDWSLRGAGEFHNGKGTLIVYKYLEAPGEGPACPEPGVPYKLSNGSVIYRRK